MSASSYYNIFSFTILEIYLIRVLIIKIISKYGNQDTQNNFSHVILST